MAAASQRGDGAVLGALADLGAVLFRVSPATLEARFFVLAESDEPLTSRSFFHDRVHPDDRERLVSLCQEVARDGVARGFEHRVVGEDGRTLWIYTRVRAGADGSGDGTLVSGFMLDLSERTRPALPEVEVRLRAVLEHAPIVLFAVDREGCITWSEGRGLEAIGLRPGELVGRSVHEVYPEQPWIADAVRRALAGEPTTVTGPVRNAWYDVWFGPIRDAGGEISGLIGVATEITHSRKISEALRDNALRLRLLCEQVPAIFWTTDRASRFTSSSGAGFATLQRRAEDLVGTTPLDWAGKPEAALLPVDAFQRAVQGEPATYEAALLGRQYQVHLEPFVDPESGALIGSVGVALDITPRKRAQEERDRLLRTEKAARAAAEAALRRSAFLAEASAVLAGSLEHEATLASLARFSVPYLADWCVVDLVEPLGGLRRVAVAHADPEKAELARALERCLPDPRATEGVPRVLREMKAATYLDLAGGDLDPEGPGWPVVGSRDPEHLRLVRALGMRSAMSLPLLGHAGALGAVTFVSAHDGRRYGASEQVLAEDLVRRAALAVENARLYEQAQEAVRAREEFLSIASHELRTPIASLLLAVQSLSRVIRRSSVAAPPQFVMAAIDTAERQSKRLARVVDDLLDISRIAGGRMHLHIEETDLAAVAAEVVESSREQIQAAGCSLSLELDGPVVGLWDRFRIEQVVTNLLSNAIKYGAGAPVRVAVGADGDSARLVVEDGGIGIPADKVDQIFDRFVRAASSRNYGGLGLGLFIVRRVLDSLGGTVTVRSTPGEGATFTVVLPRVGPRVAV